MNNLGEGGDPIRSGLLTGLGAFLMWGFSPLYFRAVGEASALEILAHRALWSLLFTFALISVSGQSADLFRIFRNRRIFFTLVLSALLVAINWLGFIWAVNNDKALEASMGYYIMPLVMVLLGRYFLDERLSRNQIIALILVCLGVLNLLWTLNSLPWIALLLAVSFGLYGLVRKKVAVNALVGLTMECLLLSPLALLYLLYLADQERLVFGALGLGFDILLACSALMTSLPLLLFTFASKRLRLGSLGLLQYLNPSCQFMLALFLFKEPFSSHHLHTFLLIWLGLGIFTLDSRRRIRLETIS